MWTNLAYRCDACHAFTQVQSRLVHSGTCARCARPLDLCGHPHPVHGLDAGAAVRDSPVPVVLVFASNWKETAAEERQAVDSLARSLSGEVTVLVADVVEDSTSLRVWQTQGRPRAVLLSHGNEIGRGNKYPAEGNVRYVLARAFPAPTSEPAPATA
jgi:hypothetical protein